MPASADGSPEQDLSLQLANLLRNTINPQNSQIPKLSDNLQINLKLNNQNYSLWTRMIRVAIGGRSKALLSHLTENPPDQQHETFDRWEQEDLIVFSWLIQNIEPSLAGNLTEFPTAKSLWDALVITYSSGKDKLQIFNLHVKANDIKQNNSSLEELWMNLQGIWGEIDRIDPNPMKCPDDIQAYSKIRSEQKLFQFLNSLDRKYENIKREIFRSDSLPSTEATYAMVRKESAHQTILGANSETQGLASGLTVAATETEGAGLATRSHRRPEGRRTSAFKEHKSHLECDVCGMKKHTADQCFEVVGYPDWWTNGHKKNKSSGPDKGKSVNDGNYTDRKNGKGSGFGGVAASNPNFWEEGAFSSSSVGHEGRER